MYKYGNKDRHALSSVHIRRFFTNAKNISCLSPSLVYVHCNDNYIRKTFHTPFMFHYKLSKSIISVQ